MIVVAKLYKLGQENGKYTKEYKKEERSNHPVEKDYLERVNANWQDNGQLYIVDEKATDKWQKEFEEKQDRIKKAKDLKQAANVNTLTEVLNSVSKESKKDETKPKKDETKDEPKQ